MTCSTLPFSLAGLESVPDRTLQALLAALTIERVYTSATLGDPLRAIAAGGAVDAELLKTAFEQEFRGTDEMQWYDGGFCENYGRLQNAIELLSTAGRDRLLGACRHDAAELAASWAERGFWDALHANGYYIDHAEVRARAGHEAREAVTERWADVREACDV